MLLTGQCWTSDTSLKPCHSIFDHFGCRGTLARFINSSCAPNCEAQKWHDAATGEIRVGIFAAQDIPPGQELTYDYMFQHAGTAALAGAYRCAHALCLLITIRQNPLDTLLIRHYPHCHVKLPCQAGLSLMEGMTACELHAQ